MPPSMIISLDNLELLQEEWAANTDPSDNTTQPGLNSPRSLEACRRAGIDPDLDLCKSTLAGVLIETLHKVSPDGTAELPIQQRDVGATMTAERVRVLKLFPFSLRNVGTDDEKLRAYEKFQQREGRRVSTIRMLREIRQQLIAAEEFKLRKAHELASAAQSKRTASPPPKPKSTPQKATKGAAANRTPSSSLRDSSLRDSSSPQDDRSDISLSTVSEATAQARLTQKTIRAHNVRTSPPRGRKENTSQPNAYIRERQTFHAKVSERSKSYSSEAHGAVSSAGQPHGGAAALSDEDDDDLFVHHAYVTAPLNDGGVEFVHYVSKGPDAAESERKTAVAFAAVDAAKRQQKRKEMERLAAIERERKQRIIEEEERAYIRKKILKDRNAHRLIQTPAPVQWNALDRSGSAAHPPLIDLAASNTSVKIHREFGEEAGPEHSQKQADVESIVSASLARAPSPTGPSLIPPVGPPQPPRSGPSSPLVTPRVGTPRDTQLSIQQSHRRGSGGSASDLAIRNSPRGPATPPRVAQPADPFELSAARRREVIDAATALRNGAWTSHVADELPSPLVSPSRVEFSNPRSPHSQGGSTGFNFSSREERARAVESRRENPRPTVTETLIHNRDDDRDERWKAVERSKRAQDLLTSMRSTHNDVAQHGETLYM